MCIQYITSKCTLKDPQTLHTYIWRPLKALCGCSIEVKHNCCTITVTSCCWVVCVSRRILEVSAGKRMVVLAQKLCVGTFLSSVLLPSPPPTLYTRTCGSLLGLWKEVPKIYLKCAGNSIVWYNCGTEQPSLTLETVLYPWGVETSH